MTDQTVDKTRLWFLRSEGIKRGPYPSGRIRRMLLQEEIGLDVEISADRRNWKPIGEVPEVVPLQLRAASGDASAQRTLEVRDQTDILSADRSTRKFPLLAMIVSLLVLGVVVGLSVWSGMPRGMDDPQCDLPAAPGVNWRSCLLLAVDVGSASLRGATLNSAVLRKAKLTATDLREADVGYADLRYADLSYALLERVSLIGANLQGADLTEADFTNADLRFADLRGARMQGAALEGARLDETIWIDGVVCGTGSIGKCLRKGAGP
ncbi:MAG: pentapeptide repeat-containing protein [gamma proteobacterium endosymbiont of Lamellibrachia anaximandri]|nr:pentapeptide repeat-containing protein [gamma proteobacterium endosymbiont of Lamellibrachia anaximandri]